MDLCTNLSRRAISISSDVRIHFPPQCKVAVVVTCKPGPSPNCKDSTLFWITKTSTVVDPYSEMFYETI